MTQPAMQSTAPAPSDEETELFSLDEAEQEEGAEPVPRRSGTAPRGTARPERASSGPGADPREGAVLGGRYRIERVLRSDASSVQAVAFHSGLGQKVMLRWLVPRPGGGPAAARFLEQARRAARLRSEHAARVIDVGRFASTLPYVATEGSEGWDLAEVLRVRGPLPVQEAVEYVLQAAEAVAEAHALGVVHGGLSLSSVVLTRRPDGSALVKVRDFGFAVELLPTAYAEDGQSAASPLLDLLAFVSPEQLRSASSDDLDPRSDVWALGAILHALLSGGGPFRNTTALGLLAAVAADPPLPLTSHRADVSPELEDVVSCCLRKERSERYPTVGELALALRAFASGDALASIERAQRPRATRPPPLPSRAPAALVHVAHPRSSPPPMVPAPAAPASRSQGWMVAVGLLGVGMGALAAVLADVSPGSTAAAGAPAGAAAPAAAPRPPEAPVVAALAVPPAAGPAAAGVAPVAPAPVLAATPAAAKLAAERGAAAGERAVAAMPPRPLPIARAAAAKVEPRAPEPEAKVGAGKPSASDLFDDIR